MVPLVALTSREAVEPASGEVAETAQPERTVAADPIGVGAVVSKETTDETPTSAPKDSHVATDVADAAVAAAPGVIPLGYSGGAPTVDPQSELPHVTETEVASAMASVDELMMPTRDDALAESSAADAVRGRLQSALGAIGKLLLQGEGLWSRLGDAFAAIRTKPGGLRRRPSSMLARSRRERPARLRRARLHRSTRPKRLAEAETASRQQREKLREDLDGLRSLLEEEERQRSAVEQRATLLKSEKEREAELVCFFFRTESWELHWSSSVYDRESTLMWADLRYSESERERLVAENYVLLDTNEDLYTTLAERDLRDKSHDLEAKDAGLQQRTRELQAKDGKLQQKTRELQERVHDLNALRKRLEELEAAVATEKREQEEVVLDIQAVCDELEVDAAAVPASRILLIPQRVKEMVVRVVHKVMGIVVAHYPSFDKKVVGQGWPKDLPDESCEADATEVAGKLFSLAADELGIVEEPADSETKDVPAAEEQEQ
uniref:Uncharacterized protein n=1 Tax=Leersia perrieri TaxID=77586 RepID=A0A0D9XVV0_9ORYZ